MNASMPSPPSTEAAVHRLLVFEPDAEGHSQEWLQHLIEFSSADRTRPAVSVVAPRTLCDALARSLPADVMGRVELRPLSPSELRWCTDRRLSLAALARWWSMRRHLRQSGADAGFFLSLDLLALPLALGLGGGGGKTLSGILFRPSVHYAGFDGHRTRGGEQLRDLRKHLFYRLMLRNRALTRVLSLDPFFPAYAARHYANGGKVEYLPDPAHPPAAVPAGNDNGLESNGRTTFLLFGYLTERKGPMVVLDALERLARPVAGKIDVVLAGRVDPALRGRLDEQCKRLATDQPQLRIRIEDRRLDQAELEGLVRRSDVVLAPYQRFVGSSGVLLWAARAGKPVLAQAYGLVGRLTQEHRLGLTVDSSDPAAVAAAITQMAQHGPSSFFDPMAAQAFAASQTPQRFAAAVLAA